jgi:hypothetical protein
MLPYETISDALLDSAEQIGLNIWQSEEQLDPQTLTRTLTLSCLPSGEASPRSSSIQASITFKWDAALTAISTLGTEGICEKYHGDNVACSHTALGCGYEATLALEINYTIPLQITLDDDIQAMQRYASIVQDLHRSIVDHRNIVEINANVQLTNGVMRLTHLKGKQRWIINSQLHELDDLQDVFEEACSEVRDMLLVLVDRFLYTGIMEDDDQLPLTLPIDDREVDRIYLRPPTA